MSEESTWVFVQHETEVWVVAEVTRESDGQITVSAASQYGGDSTNLRSSEVVRISSLETLNAPPPDLIKLLDVNRASIFYSLCKRFRENEIYTAIGPVLVAVNPFKWITGLYDPSLVPKYKKDEYTLSDHPHLFAMAAGAVRGLANGFKQSLIISGESGSGKTEATKQCLYFLTKMTEGDDIDNMNEEQLAQHRQGKRTMSSSEEQPESLAALTGVQGRILSASPVLEAFGNAKTIRNNNSSRFGKFIEIYLGAEQKQIESSTNTTYLLEKSRVVKREKEERNYHIFYQLLAGYPPEMLEKLGLKDLSKNLSRINYLDGCSTIPNVDDADEFSKVMSALESLGFSEPDIDHLMTMLAGILHLGQVSFVNDPKTDGSKISNHSDAEHSLPHAASTLGVTEAALKQSLLFRTIKTKAGTRTSIMFKPYSKEAATDNRDAMAKEIYTRIFDWIVQKVNEAVNPEGLTAGRYTGGLRNAAGDGRGFIGILDIFGFEIFQKNSLEQLCINFANESLQHHFNFHIFTGEMELYEREGIGGIKLDYKDNKNVLDLLVKKPTGILCLLDEEVKVPRGSDDGFVNKCIRAHEKNPIFKNRHKIRSFGVVHYAGVVDYQKEGFLQKNNDTLSSDVVELLNESSTGLLKTIFSDDASAARDAKLLQDAGVESSGAGSSKPGPQSKGNKITVARRFTLQLDALVKQLNTTQPKYIRCIKPNDNKAPNEMNHVLLDQQLDYSGVFDAVHIMQSGYPVKLKLASFVSRYHGLAINLAASHETENEHKERRKGGTGGRSAFRNGGYDTIFPRHKGVVLSSNSAAKFEATVTHDTVAKLLALLVTEKGIVAAKELIVGKTLVFGRPEPSDSLERALRVQRKVAVTFLQKNMRYLVYNRLAVGIIEPYKKLKAATLAKDGPLLKELLEQNPTTHLEDTVEQLLSSAMMVFHGSISARRGGGYGLEVNRKIRLVAEEASMVLNRHLMLKAKIREGIERSDLHPDNVFGEYDELVAGTKAMRENTLLVDNYPYKFDSWEWSYEQDKEAVEMARRVDNFALVVTIKRRFDKHSDTVSEGELATTLEDLINLRTSGDLPPTYCLNEEKRARGIVKNAIDIYMEYYDLMVEALEDGGMKVKALEGGVNPQSQQSQGQEAEIAAAQTRKSLVGAMFGPGADSESLADMISSELEYSVDSKMLSVLFSQWDRSKELHEQSQKTSDLIEIGRSLVYLREYAENSQWKTLWTALNKNGWMQLIPYALKAGDPVPKRQSLSAGASVDLQVPQLDSNLAAIDEGENEEEEEEEGDDYMPPPPNKPTRRPTVAPRRPSTAPPAPAVSADDPDVLAAAALEAKVQEEALLDPPLVRPLFQLYTLQKAPYFIDIETAQLFWTVPKDHSLASVAILSHISEEEASATSGEAVDEGSMKMYFEKVSTQEVTWDMPALPAPVTESIAAMYVGDIAACEKLVGEPYDHDRGQEHLIAIDDYLESDVRAQAVDNDGYSEESREAENVQIAQRNLALREEILARHLLEAQARSKASERRLSDSAEAVAAALDSEEKEKKEKEKKEKKEKPKKHGSVHETARLSTLQLLQVVKLNDDLYEGQHSVGHGVTIPKGLQAVLGREIYNLCYACLHYSCFREIASILTETKNIPDAIVKDFVPAYERRASATIIGVDDPGMELSPRSSVSFLHQAGLPGGENRSDMIPLVCSGLELDLSSVVPREWNRLLALISEAGMHQEMFDSNQTCLFYLAKRHTRLHEGVFLASTDADALEAIIDAVCSIAPLEDEPAHHMWIDRSHGDMRIAQSALAFYRYRSSLSKYVYKALQVGSIPAPVVPKNRKKSRRSTQRASVLAVAVAPSAEGEVPSLGITEYTALDFNSVGRAAINTFESLIAGATDPAKCPPIRASQLGEWEELMSIAEVAWTLRGAVNEIDSSHVRVDSITPLSEKDEEEVTAVLALIEAVRENEPWIDRYMGEEAARSLSPDGGEGADYEAKSAGADEGEERAGGRGRGREREPSIAGGSPGKADKGRDGRRSSGGSGRKKSRRTRFGSSGGGASSSQSPPPPTSAPPPEKVAAAKARQEAAAAAAASAGATVRARDGESEERYRHTQSSFGKSVHSHAKVVVNEMNRIESELRHILAISSIARALLHGAVKGEVGSLKVEDIDYTTLPQVIMKHMPVVQMNPNIGMLIEDAELLVGLRKMLRLQDMDEVGRIIGPIAEHDPLFVTCHENTREELQVIHMEYTNYWSLQLLQGVLRSGSLAVNHKYLKDDSVVGACGDPMGIDLLEVTASASASAAKTKKNESAYKKLLAHQDALQKAIVEVEKAPTRTPEVHQLLFDAKIAHAIRRTVLLGQWEPLLANQSLTWGALDMSNLALLLCASDKLRGQFGGDGVSDLLAPPSMSDRDPLLTVLGKGMVVQDEPEEEESGEGGRRASAPHPPPPPPDHARRGTSYHPVTTYHAGQPPPPAGGPKHGQPRGGGTNPDAPPVPSAARVHFDETVPMPVAPKPLVPLATSIDRKAKRRLIVDLPVQPSQEERLRCALQVIEAVNSLDSPMSTLRVPLVSIAINSVLHAGEAAQSQNTGSISHDNASLASGLTVAEILSFLEHLAAPDNEAFNDVVIQDLPLESWESKFNSGDNNSAAAASTSGAGKAPQPNVLSSASNVYTAGGKDLPFIRKVEHRAVLQDLHHAIRLSHDRKARVLLSVSVLAGQVTQIETLEKEVNRHMEQFHRDCEKFSDLEDADALRQAPGKLREDVTRTLGRHVDKEAAKKGLKAFYSMLHMTGTHENYPFEKPPIAIETTPDGMGMLSAGYLTETVRCWWLMAQHLVHVRSAISKQIDAYLDRELGAEGAPDGGLRESTVRRRRASSMLDSYALGSLGTIEPTRRYGEEEELYAEEEEIRDDHFELQVNKVGLLHAGMVDKTLATTRACYSLPQISAAQELKTLRKLYVDCETREKLLAALQTGGPTYDKEGRFVSDSKAVDTEKLAGILGSDRVRQEEHAGSGARGTFFRSPRLERMIEFGYICLSLRQGLVDNNWTDSEYAAVGEKVEKHDDKDKDTEKDDKDKNEKEKEGDGAEETSAGTSTGTGASASARPYRAKVPLRTVIANFHETMHKYGTKSSYYDAVLLNAANRSIGGHNYDAGDDYGDGDGDGRDHGQLRDNLHLEGIPPKRLLQDFVMVEHELQKIDILAAYTTQYRQGALSGDSLKLNLQHVDTAGLEKAVNSISKWRYQKRLLPVQKAFKDKLDAHMATHMKAAQELISVRKEIIAINEQFRRSLPVVATGPNRVMMLKDFMARYNIVGTAMQNSIDNCSSLFDLPQNITQIWDRVDNLVTYQCVHAGKLNFMHHELRLMKEESLSRRFLWAQVRIFNSINNTDITANKAAALETMSDLASNFRKFNEDLKALSKFANKVIKPSPVVEAVATSSALLFHLIRAQLFTDCFDRLSKENEQGAFDVPSIFEAGDDEEEAKKRHDLRKQALTDKRAKAALNRLDEHRKLGSRLRRRKENVDAMLSTLGKVIEEPHAEWRTCKGALTSDGLVGEHGTPSVQLLKMSCGGSYGDDVAADLRNTVELIAKMCAPAKKKKDDDNQGGSSRSGGFDKEELSDDEEGTAHLLDNPPSEGEDDDEAFKGTHATLAELEQEITGDYHSYAAMTYAREEHEKKRQSFQIFSVQAVIRSYFRHTESENGDGMGALGTLQVSAFKLHPVVRKKFVNAITDTANTYDIFDMKRALKVGNVEEPGRATGEPGNIEYQSVGNKPLINVLARIRNEKDEINRFNLITGFSASEMASYITSKAPTRKAPVPPGGATAAPTSAESLESRAGARDGESESFRRLYANLGAEQYPESFRRQLALKFLRMSNMLPERVVRARMRGEGISDRDVDTFFENLYSGNSDGGSGSGSGSAGDGAAAGGKGTVYKQDAALDEALSIRRRKMGNESLLLQRSCEIIACMRDIVVRQDYRSGFDLLEMFITPIAEEMTEIAVSADQRVQPSGSGATRTPDKRVAGATSVSVSASGERSSKTGSAKKARPSQTMSLSSRGSIGTQVFYNIVHDHCREEFELLTMDICMGFWRALEGSTLAPGVYLKIYTSLLMLSEQSPAMRSLCGESIRLIDEGRTADMSKALSPASKGQDQGRGSEEGKGSGSDDDEGDGTWRQVNPPSSGDQDKGSGKGSSKQVRPAGPKKRLPPLKVTPEELQPAASKKEGAPKMAATEYSAASAEALSQTDSDASVISRSEPEVLAKRGPRGEVLKKLSHSSSQTDGTDLLEVVDPVYHKKHQELVQSKEAATRRLAAMRAEKDRVLALLNLREIESARKVKQKEEESIAVIQRMWDNDAKRVEQMKTSLEEERVQYELEMKAQRHAEYDIHALYNYRREQLAATAARLKHHHETVLGQRKYAAHARLRADLGTRKLHNILARKLDVEKLRAANKERTEVHKRNISASSALYASSEKRGRGGSTTFESKR